MQKKINQEKWLNLRVITTPDNKIGNNLALNISYQPFLKNELISVHQPVIQKPLNEWAKSLNVAIQEINFQRNKHSLIEKIANIFQQATFIFLSINNIKYARELCYSQIQTFIQFNEKYAGINLLKYVFKPWINLIRIDRKAGNIFDAFEKLNALNRETLSVSALGENKVLMESLHYALKQDAKMKLKIMSQSVIEKIKLYLFTKQYIKLIQFIEEIKIYVEDSYQTLIKEALIIAYINSGKVSQAYHLMLSENHNRNDCSILKLRECEMRVMLYNRNYFMDKNGLFSQLASLMLNSGDMTIQESIFSLYLAQLMNSVGMQENALCLADLCLQSAIKLNDQVLVADSLITLYGLSSENEKRKRIENTMVTHYFNTQYETARQKMLTCFHDLKYVETNDNQDEMMFLYENLLTFNFYS